MDEVGFFHPCKSQDSETLIEYHDQRLEQAAKAVNDSSSLNENEMVILWTDDGTHRLIVRSLVVAERKPLSRADYGIDFGRSLDCTPNAEFEKVGAG